MARNVSCAADMPGAPIRICEGLGICRTGHTVRTPVNVAVYAGPLRTHKRYVRNSFLDVAEWLDDAALRPSALLSVVPVPKCQITPAANFPINAVRAMGPRSLAFLAWKQAALTLNTAFEGKPDAADLVAILPALAVTRLFQIHSE
jgi:hypothetical protein